MEQPKATCDFVPYKFGCYSYSAHADLMTMVAKGLLEESKKDFVKLDQRDYLTWVKTEDLKLLQRVKTAYGRMNINALMKHTYIHYPFYAINSEVAAKILDKHELEKVEAARPHNNETILFTIGYEGISLEEYLTRLLKNDVKILVDVRNNPLSMKYGFSKTSLKKYCESLGIKYIHIPEVGIQSAQRQELKTQSDYDALFTVYRKQTLAQTTNAQTDMLNLLKAYKRIALTCFEANICQCHRKHLAEAIKTLPGFEYTVEHI
jgi:predicted nucleotidyltransferase